MTLYERARKADDPLLSRGERVKKLLALGFSSTIVAKTVRCSYSYVSGFVTKEGRKKVSKKTQGKSRQKLIKELDYVFSQYIRARDTFKGHFGYPVPGKTQCIACLKMTNHKVDAGHYIERGCFRYRWDEDNVHAECSTCNAFDPSHLIGYRKNLVKKIGAKKVNEIEKGYLEWKRNGKSWKLSDVEWLEDKIQHYRKEFNKFINI